MRQSGVLAAAGIVALDTGVTRLVEDHERLHKLVTGMVHIPSLIISSQLCPGSHYFLSQLWLT